jgi:hypothetical protein
VTVIDDPALSSFDPGEGAAIALGITPKADLILVDDCGVMLPPSRTGSKSPAPSAFWISAPSGS